MRIFCNFEQADVLQLFYFLNHHLLGKALYFIKLQPQVKNGPWFSFRWFPLKCLKGECYQFSRMRESATNMQEKSNKKLCPTEYFLTSEFVRPNSRCNRLGVK
jgi:hypothetical protein